MISTHVLNLGNGQPAQSVEVTLFKKEDSNWKTMATEKTNSDGRIQFTIPADEGDYQLNFNLVQYFKENKSDAFFTEAPILFRITDTERKYHVPLLLNQYGYSTYRGS